MSRFKSIDRTKPTVTLSLEWEEKQKADKFKYDVHLTTPKDTDYWKYHSEAFWVNGQKNGEEVLQSILKIMEFFNQTH